MVDVCWDPSPGGAVAGTTLAAPGQASGPSHAVEPVTSTVQSEQVPDPPRPARLGRCRHPGQYLAPALIRRTFKSSQAAGFSGGGRPSTLLLCSLAHPRRLSPRWATDSAFISSTLLHTYGSTEYTCALEFTRPCVCWFHVFSSFRAWAGAGPSHSRVSSSIDSLRGQLTTCDGAVPRRGVSPPCRGREHREVRERFVRQILLGGTAHAQVHST